MIEDKTAFEGWVTHPSLGAEVVWGRIVFVGWRLRFESVTVAREVPLVKLRLERDETAQGGIVFCDPDHAEWLIHIPDQEILEHSPLLQQAHARNQIREQETFIEDAKLQTNLLRAVAPLVRAAPTNALGFKFYILKSPAPNAFALPGGHVVVTTSLLELADRPEEVAGVVAHELAHVTRKHALRKILSSAGPYILCRLFMRGNSGLMGLLAGSSQLLVCQTFSQEYELEADDVGWQLLLAAHIDPRGLPDMLNKLKAVQERMKLVRLAPQAFSSHPATDKRIRRLEAKWQRLKDKSGFIEYDSAKRE